jgi:hypothetical protein
MPDAVASVRRATGPDKTPCDPGRTARSRRSGCAAGRPGPAARTSRPWRNRRRGRGGRTAGRPGRGPTRTAPGRGPGPKTPREARRARPCSSARRRCGRRASSRPVAAGSFRRSPPAVRTSARPRGSDAVADRLLPAPAAPLRPRGSRGRAYARARTREPRATTRPCRATGGAVEACPLQVRQGSVYGRRPGPGAARHQAPDAHPRHGVDVAPGKRLLAFA